MPPRLAMTPEQAEELATSAFVFLAAEPERIERFAGMHGVDLADIRSLAREPQFLAGVLGYLLQDEAALLDCAAALGVKPVSIPLAYRVIPHGDPEFPISLDAMR